MGTSGMEGGIPRGFNTVTLLPIILERFTDTVFPSRMTPQAKAKRPQQTHRFQIQIHHGAVELPGERLIFDKNDLNCQWALKLTS